MGCSSPETSGPDSVPSASGKSDKVELGQSSGHLYDAAFAQMKSRIDAQLDQPLIVPVPKDAGGGYTHEQHKRNAKAIFEAGLLFEASGEARYADHLIRYLDEYAGMYSDLPLHPKQKEQTPGRLFWQSLNEAWWLVHAAQGYDKIRASLDDETKTRVEDGLFHPMVEFLSVGQPQTFDKIHNHGTWATAAVGLTGYALDREDYVEKALLGLDLSGEGGFLRQLNVLFSPDGYYNEGPYYQRYALMPFVIFAQAVEKNNPERKIFEQRDGILKKAIFTTIQQSYGGLFFPINDAIKDKGIATTELLHGVSIAYDLTGDKGLLSIAEAQGKFVLTPESRKLAQDLSAGKAEPFDYKSMRLRDGENGTEGGLDILRASADPNDLTLVAKNTSQGLGHGHFDKLGFLLYDAGHDIIRDYGAARFLNVEAKYGGHYLPENNRWAKQTIAHNALVVDEVSHFKGDTQTGNENPPQLGEFLDSDNLKITTAEIETAYDDVSLGRTMALIKDEALEYPIIVDLMEAHSENAHQYDLPFYYNGQLVETNFDLKAATNARQILGPKNGYQYLWKVGQGIPKDISQITWLKDRRFYTVTTTMPKGSSVIFAEIGASDPDFNLRREPAFILRANSNDGVSYASVIEPHGEYNPTVEFTLNSHSQIESVEHFESGADEFILVTTKTGKTIGLGIADDPDKSSQHTVSVNGEEMTWSGPYHLFSSEKVEN